MHACSSPEKSIATYASFSLMSRTISLSAVLPAEIEPKTQRAERGAKCCRAVSGSIPGSVRRERVASLSHELSKGSEGRGVKAVHSEYPGWPCSLGEVPSGQVEAADRVGHRVALVDRHTVGDAVARVEDDAARAARRIERHHLLDADVQGRHIERLEHHLCDPLAVGLRVARWLRHEHRVLLGRHAKLVVERVVPDLLHVVPVAHDAVLDRVLERQDAALALRLVANVGVLLALCTRRRQPARHMRACHAAGVCEEHVGPPNNQDRRAALLMVECWTAQQS
eukprot:4313723-Prymnesium_polylepis.1